MEKYNFDFTTKTLTITKAFDEKASTPDTEEYILLTRFQRDFPDLTIVRKSHKSPKKYQAKSGEVYNCNQYKNLTYANMERFISVLPNSDDLMQVYYYLRYGIGKVQTNTYKIVREWFIQQFPLYRKDPLFYLNNEVKIIEYKKIISDQEATEISKADKAAS